MLYDLTDPGPLLSRVAAAHRPPRKAGKPQESREVSYRDYAALNRPGQRGALTVRCADPAAAVTTLQVDQHRLCRDGYSYYTSARLQCRSDSVCSLQSWEVESKVALAADLYLDLLNGVRA